MFHAPLVLSRSTVQRIPAQGNGRRLLRRKGQVLAAMGEVIDAGVITGKYVQGPRVAALEQLIAHRCLPPLPSIPARPPCTSRFRPCSCQQEGKSSCQR